MRIKITIDDEYLRDWWNIKKDRVYLVQEVLYANKTNKKKRYVKGYKIRGKVLYDCNSKGQFTTVYIGLHECEIKK